MDLRWIEMLSFRRLISGKFTTNSPRKKVVWRNFLTKDHRTRFSWWNSGPIWAPTSQKMSGHFTPSLPSKWTTSVFSKWMTHSDRFSNVLKKKVRKQREYDDYVFDESLFVWQTSRGEGGNGIRSIRERALRLPHPSVAHVRVHDQLYPQAQTLDRKVHDEQRPRELYHLAGTWIVFLSLLSIFDGVQLHLLHTSLSFFLYFFSRRRRWWRIETRKRRSSAWLMFSKCPRRSTEPSTTFTDWWKIDRLNHQPTDRQAIIFVCALSVLFLWVCEIKEEGK